MTSLKRTGLGISAVVLVALAGGCDDSTPLSEALYKATNQINALSPGGGVPASPAYKEKVFGDVIRSLQASASSGTQSETSAAHVLIAQAQAGLAENPAAEAAEDQRRSLNLLTAIEAALDQWQRHNAAAAAAGSYDPGPAITELDQQSREREGEIRKEQAHKAEVDAAVAKLLAEAAATAANAQSRRAAQIDLAAQASSGSAVKGEELIRQAAQVGREADALEAQAADLEAQAAKIAPTSDEIALSIQRLTNQRTLLDASKSEVIARAEAYGVSARESRSMAQDDAAEIERQVEALGKIGSGEGPSAFDRAVQGFESAAGSAKKAQDPIARSQAMLTSGAARHALGDLHWSRAHTLARQVETLDALANAQPPLPKATEYKAIAAELRKEQSEALEAATAAYQAAFDDYQSAGAKGETQQRMERVRERLGKIAKATSGGKVDLMAGMTPSEAEPSGAAPQEDAPEAAVVAEADQKTPAGTIALLIQRSQADDAEGVFDLLHAADGAQRATLDTMRPIAIKAAQLNEACREKFGEGLEGGQLAQMGGGGLSGDQFRSLTAEDFTIEESGETATASHAGLPNPIPLIRVNGNWMIDFGGMDPSGQMAAAQANPQMRAMIGALSTALDETTAEVEADRHTSVESVQQALMQKIQRAMMGGLQNLPRPGGGG